MRTLEGKQEAERAEHFQAVARAAEEAARTDAWPRELWAAVARAVDGVPQLLVTETFVREHLDAAKTLVESVIGVLVELHALRAGLPPPDDAGDSPAPSAHGEGAPAAGASKVAIDTEV